MVASALCAVQAGSTWQTRDCSRTLLGWALGEQRAVKTRATEELMSALAPRAQRGVIGIAIGRENLLVRLHEESDNPDDLFPTGEELIYWRRQVVADGACRTESIGLRRTDAVRLHREAQRAGFSRCVLFPTWIGSIVGSRDAKPGTVLGFESGFLQRVGRSWSQWCPGTQNESDRPNAVISGVENALSGGLLIAIENSVPPGWSSVPPRKPGTRWLPAAVFLMALIVAFAGRWDWMGRQVASERATLESLRSIHQAQTRMPGCTMTNLMAMFQMIGQEARKRVTATTLTYLGSEGLSLSGIGSSPSRIRAFLKGAGITEKTLSLTARNGDFFFQMDGAIECDH